VANRIGRRSHFDGWRGRRGTHRRPTPPPAAHPMAAAASPGGAVTAYAWDMEGGGFPYEALQEEMRGLGVSVPTPPSPAASRIDVMQDLWMSAGLESVETREITVRRAFSDFDDYWATVLGGPSVGPQLAAMASGELALLKARMRERLPAGAAGSITYGARANAAKGYTPKT